MTVRDLLGILRDQGLLRYTPVTPGGEQDQDVEAALAMLAGAYEIKDDHVVVPPQYAEDWDHYGPKPLT